MAKQKHLLEVKPDFLDPEIKYPNNVRRLDPGASGAGRFYFKVKRVKKRNVYIPAISVTTVAKIVIPKGPGLIKWLIANGDKSERVRDATALFGTEFHKAAFFQILTGKHYDLDYLKEEYDESLNNFNMLFPPGFREESKTWEYSFTRGFLSWCQFFSEKIIKVLAVEIPMVSEQWGIGATLDLVAIVNFNGKPRLAIIDIKSKIFYLMSKANVSKQFYDEHKFQLSVQKLLLCENYPEIVDKYANGNPDEILLFNWAPTAWHAKLKEDEEGNDYLTGGPTFTFENHTPPHKNKYESEVTIHLGRRRRPFKYKMIEHILTQIQHEKLPQPPSHLTGTYGKVDMTNFDWRNHVDYLNIKM